MYGRLERSCGLDLKLGPFAFFLSFSFHPRFLPCSCTMSEIHIDHVLSELTLNEKVELLSGILPSLF